MANIRVVEAGFLRKNKKHDLDKPIKALARELEDIIDRLVIASKEIEKPDGDIKAGVKACELVLGYYNDMVKQKDTDEMQRMLAHFKYGDGSQSAEAEETCLIDFDTIQN
jgi:hypothetical protein